MKVNFNPQVSFQKYIRIQLEDKSLTDGRLNPTPMDKIWRIANGNDITLFVTKDVFILNSTDKVKEQLTECGIDFEEVDSVEGCQDKK